MRSILQKSFAIAAVLGLTALGFGSAYPPVTQSKSSSRVDELKSGPSYFN